MGRLKDKVAIITGAASGQGACELEVFLKEGAKVVATDINIDLLNENVQKLKSDYPDVIAVKHDVSSPDDWITVVDEAMNHFGRIDVLVNNAGILISKQILDCSVEEWNKIMDVNSTSVYLGMKHVIEKMIHNENGGSIINISSVDAIVGSSSSAPYTASKGAVRSLTKNTAVNYGKYNIRVNSVHPGFIVTPMTKSQLSDGGSSEQTDVPLQRLGKPEDVAYGVLYLASDEASFVTGAELVIDGGLTAK